MLHFSVLHALFPNVLSFLIFIVHFYVPLPEYKFYKGGIIIFY